MADMPLLNHDVRFTPPNADILSGLPMSAKCQRLSYALQQTASLFDHLVVVR